MFITYNGIDLEMLELEDFSEDVVYDDTGTDYLFTRITIQGLFIVNGQSEVASVTPATSYDVNTGAAETLRQLWQRTSPPKAALPLGGGPPGVNNPTYGHVGCTNGPFPFVSGDGVYATTTQNQLVDFVFKSVVPAVNTETVIRSRLSQPRAPLFVWTGNGDPGRRDELLLLSPKWGAHTDCRNGPKPRVKSVNAFFGGDSTFVVSWGCETFINEAASLITDESTNAKNTQTGVALLSNRFKCRHVVDKDSYLSIETVGTAIFRTDLLYRNPATNPDQFRFSTLLPVPFGMMREQLDIDPLPDASGYQYRYVDVQQQANFVGGPYVAATDVQAVHRQAILLDEDALSGALHAYERVLNIRANKKISTGEAGAVPPKSGLDMSGLLSLGKDKRK